jgi:hypothetical protein
LTVVLQSFIFPSMNDLRPSAQNHGDLARFHPYEAHVTAVLDDLAQGSARRFRALAMGWLFRGRHDRLRDLVSLVADTLGAPLLRVHARLVDPLVQEAEEAWRQGRLRRRDRDALRELAADILRRGRTARVAS